MPPSTPASVTIDLNEAPVVGGSSSGGMRKHQREIPADMLTGACNLSNGMLAAVNDDTANRFLENVIFEVAPAAGAYDPDETQSHNGRASFTQATNDLHDAFMQDQVGLDGFPLDHEFSKDYGLEEEDDDMDIDEEPLFEEELANQTSAGLSRSAIASGRRHTRHAFLYVGKCAIMTTGVVEFSRLFVCWHVLAGGKFVSMNYVVVLWRLAMYVSRWHELLGVDMKHF
ncbi:DNA repair protein rhp54 [Hordeum vulgare]|nr:DNA repair protein rhp54 [Hordeum vulgare]